MNIIEDLWKSRHPMDSLFLDLIDGYDIIKKDKYHIIFYVKNDKILFELYENTITVSRVFWSDFLSDFKIPYTQRIPIFLSILNNHLNLNIKGINIMSTNHSSDIKYYE